MGSPRDRPDQKRKEPLWPGDVSAWVWLAALSLFLVISVVFVAPPHEVGPTNLPYSSFLKQVQAGNVMYVELQGQQVPGRFKESISWSLDDTEETRHATFVTTLPSVNDPRFLPLLEEEGVTVTARTESNLWNTILLGAGGRLSVSFADVAGEERAKPELAEIVDFLQHPAKYGWLGARIPRGVLLIGPPGTGKTFSRHRSVERHPVSPPHLVPG